MYIYIYIYIYIYKGGIHIYIKGENISAKMMRARVGDRVRDI